jgi:serine/threonine protein kinase
VQDGPEDFGRYGTAGGKTFGSAGSRRSRGVGAHRAVDRPDDDSEFRYGIRGLVTDSRPDTDRDDDIPEPRDSGADADADTEVVDEVDQEQPIEDGQTLRELLNERHLEPAEATRLGAQLAGALAGLHRRGGVHGQLTPLTVRILPTGRARLLEPPDTPADSLDPASVPYLSPEQVTGDPATPASDVYALGLVLLEACTGYPAYPGSSWEAAAQRLSTPPVVPNEVPGPLAGTLLAMTQTAPGDRPTADRASARFGGGGSAPPPVAAPGPVPGAGMSQLVVLGLPVVILLGLIAVALLNHHGSLSDGTENTASPAGVVPATTAPITPAPITPAPAARATTPARTAHNTAAAHAATPTATVPTATVPTATVPTASVPTAGTPPSGLALPDLKAPDLPSSVTDSITNTIVDRAKGTWQRFTTWFGALF